VLRIAARIPATEAEGPGLRYAVWLQGCPLRCQGCCNPAMLPFEGGSCIAVSELVAEIEATPGIEGVTFLGGEPFAQSQPLARVAAAVQAKGLSVLVFTGYTLEELCGRASAAALLAATDLLVDGRYAAGMPSPLRFVGSANQRLHAFTPRGAVLARGFEAGPDVVEIRIDGARVSVNGTPESFGATCGDSRRGSRR
jgi:anaerobic ribonucleoside-triphosphate reductase activating protein